jgi:hypothetical protein
LANVNKIVFLTTDQKVIGLSPIGVTFSTENQQVTRKLQETCKIIDSVTNY